MKKVIALLIVLSASIESALTQASLIDTSKVWITEYYTWMGGTQEPRMYKFIDTVHDNGLIYYKLYATVELNVDEFYFTGNIYREENDRIYAKLGNRSSEELVMDQSISVGDTLKLNWDYILSRIDTVVLKTGEERKRFVFNEGQWTSYWIENIGFETGGLYDILGWDLSSKINCFYKSDSLIYSYQYALGGYEYPCIEDLSEMSIYRGRFVSNINRWFIDENVSGPTSFEGNRLYRFSGNKTINGQEYAQLSYSTTPWNLNLLESFWREDSQGSVYTLIDSTEHLVYNFDLEVGDPVPMVSDSAFVENIELIEMLPLYWNIEDEGIRRRFEINKGNGELIYWVEGIGSETAPFALANSIPSDSINDLLCFYNYNTRRYSPEGNGYCTSLDISENLQIIASEQDDFVQISWSPVNERDEGQFIIERSVDAKDWVIIEKLNSQSTSYIDKTPMQDVNYYRLSLVLDKGEVIESNVEAVIFERRNEVRIFPNPTSGELNISGINHGIYRIYNTVGSAIKNGSIIESSLDISELTSGVYFIEIIDTKQEKTILKFIKS